MFLLVLNVELTILKLRMCLFYLFQWIVGTALMTILSSTTATLLPQKSALKQ